MSAVTRCTRPRSSARPFAARDDARQDVEGDQPLGRLLRAIDGEGDADAAEQQLGLFAPRGEKFRRGAGKPLRKLLIGNAGRAVRRRPFHRIASRDDPRIDAPLFAGARLFWASRRHAAGVRHKKRASCAAGCCHMIHTQPGYLNSERRLCCARADDFRALSALRQSS